MSPGGTALVARLDSAGDVLITGPAVRAVAAAHERVVFLAGPRGSAAADLLPGVDEVLEWQAPWVDFGSPALTGGHVEALVKQIIDIDAQRALIFTSFHQSPLPLALLLRMAGVGWIGAVSADYPGSLLDLRHHVETDIAEPVRALFLAQAAGYLLPPGDDGRLRIRRMPLPDRLSRQIGDQPYLVFHPGAAVPARQPSALRSASMVSALTGAGYRVVVTGAPGDRQLTRTVAGLHGTDPGGRHDTGRTGRGDRRGPGARRAEHRTGASGRRRGHPRRLDVRPGRASAPMVALPDPGGGAGRSGGAVPADAGADLSGSRTPLPGRHRRRRRRRRGQGCHQSARRTG